LSFASGVSAAQGGVVLTGPPTGNLVRHLWSADPVNGLCRLDPDIDTPGPHWINSATCLTTAAGAALPAKINRQRRRLGYRCVAT
jgi:hypothetical protein